MWQIAMKSIGAINWWGMCSLGYTACNGAGMCCGATDQASAIKWKNLSGKTFKEFSGSEIFWLNGEMFTQCRRGRRLNNQKDVLRLVRTPTGYHNDEIFVTDFIDGIL